MNYSLSSISYPIYVYLNENNPFDDSVVVNGLKITRDKCLISCEETMNKLNVIQQYLNVEPYLGV